MNNIRKKSVKLAMNTVLLRRVRTLCAAVLLTACAASTVRADATKMAAKEKTCSGTITALDANGKVITVQSYLFRKTFVLGDNCTMSLKDKNSAMLGDFRPGQRVNISYVDAHGVLVADRITQDVLTFAGQVREFDRNTRMLKVRLRGSSKTFAVADNCQVLLRDDAKGGFADVKPGDRVTVIYEVPANQLTAREIDQRSLTTAGTLYAVNLADHTINISNGRQPGRLYRLADDCAIIVGNKFDARLDELQTGQTYELSYDAVEGVNVVNRIALAPSPAKAGIARPAAKPVADAN